MSDDMAPEQDPEREGLVELGVRPSLREYLRSVWQRRDFALTIPIGQLRAQNQDTVLGQFWHLLNPLFSAAVYYLIFGVILQIDRGVDNFPAFLIVGVFIFQYITKSLMAGARVIISNVKLMQSINFPRIILPLGAVIGETVAFVPGLGAMGLVLILTGEYPSIFWLLAFPIIALQAIFNLGLALVAARSTFHFRDVQNVLPYLTRIWFYASGVLFSIEAWTEGTLQLVLELNPAYAFLELMRDAMLHGRIDPQLWMVAAGWTTIIFCFGFWWFSRHETEYGRG